MTDRYDDDAPDHADWTGGGADDRDAREGPDARNRRDVRRRPASHDQADARDSGRAAVGTGVGRPRAPTDRSVGVAAIAGGATSIVLAALPFSPVLGGLVAGYLRGGETGDGVRAGAAAGLVALVPLVLVGLAVVGFAFAAVVVEAPAGVVSLGAFAAVFALGLAVAYTVGLSALGGVAGAYVRREDVF